MSPAPADHVNAVELAGRSATLERSLRLKDLPRVVEAGALEGTHVTARLEFGTFEGRATIAAKVVGEVVLTCQRCLGACACGIDESALLAVVPDDSTQVPGGYEPVIGDPERLGVVELIEDQVLLGLPLVPRHEDAAQCARVAVATAEPAAATEDRQRPFANLRELLDKGSG